MDDSKLVEIILDEKYKGREIEELWKDLLEINSEINCFFEASLFQDFYDSMSETLFISSEIKKKTFNEKQYLATSLKFWQEYWKLTGNFREAARLGEQLAYLQKLAY